MMAEAIAWLVHLGEDAFFALVLTAFLAASARFGWWCGGEDW